MADNRDYDELVSLMIRKEGIHINRIRDILLNYSSEEFNGFVRLVLDSHDFNLFEQFVYYLTLFKDFAEIQAHITNDKVSVEVLEHILLYTYARASLNNVPEDQALDRILIFIEQDKYLDLLLKSDIISRDKLLSYYILTKLDRKHIDIFFNSHPDIVGFLNGFISLPDRTIKTILTKNPDLFGYISMFLQTLDARFAEGFIEKYEIDIQEMEKIKQIILDITSNYDIESEKKLPLSRRNKKRLAEIVLRIKEMNNIFNILHTLESEGVIIDEVEEKLISEILSNPLFKDVLMKYS
ncbi:MAG: hypothetical protein ACOCWH_01695, partial [Spirochaetota bacterium]